MKKRDLTAHIERGLSDLRDLVALESVSAQGRMLSETATSVSLLLETEGFTVQPYPGQVAPILLAEAGEGPFTLLIYNHYDVQPEDPLDLWDSPPFTLTERDGRLYGRGASDDKGELASRLAAIRAVKEANGGQLPIKIKWLIEGEEEVGSPSLVEFVETHQHELKADGCWWEFGGLRDDGRPIISLGLKGITCLELRCTLADSDLHSSLGAVVDNPLYRLAKAVTSIRDDQGNILIPGFHDAVREPTPADLDALKSIDADEQKLQQTFGIKRLFAQGYEYAYRTNFKPIVNVNGWGGGYQGQGSKTVLPAHGFVKIDFRLVPDQDPAHIVQLLRAHLDAQDMQDIEIIELEAHQKSARSDMNAPFVQACIAAARDVHGEPIIHPSAGGSGPMHPFTDTLGIPCVAAGIGNSAGRVHAPNENIVKAHFEKGVEFGVELIGRLGKG